MIQGGTPTDLEDLRRRLLALESWKGVTDTQVGKITGIETGLAQAKLDIEKLSGLPNKVNDLGDDLVKLTTRVATLELQLQVAGKVRISGFDPPDQIPVGQVLTILGAGFKPAVIENLVFINDTPIYNFRLDSDSSRLKVVVPLSIPGVSPTAGGVPVTIRVSNNDGEAQKTCKVTLPLPVTGTPPLITSVGDMSTQHPPIRFNFTAFARGDGLGNYQDIPTVRLIYSTPNGPVSYFAANVNANVISMTFDVPDIKEAPPSGTFPVLVEIKRGNHVPALAQVLMTRST
jgi:hypothetical protein